MWWYCRHVQPSIAFDGNEIFTCDEEIPPEALNTTTGVPLRCLIFPVGVLYDHSDQSDELLIAPRDLRINVAHGIREGVDKSLGPFIHDLVINALLGLEIRQVLADRYVDVLEDVEPQFLISPRVHALLSPNVRKQLG